MIGELAGSVLAAGAAHEELLVSGAYPQLAFAGEVPGLLSELGSAHTLPAAEIELAASGWEPIGLGAIQDVAQERYGPVDMDRSKVRLDPASKPMPYYPACAGGRFSFPAELDEQRAGMCAEHAEQPQQVITERLERAPARNRDGWDAIVGGSSMRSEPTAMFANDVAVILTDAGRGEQARQRMEQNLRRFPDDLWTQIHTGDVHLALSDRARAEQAFRDALAIARAHADASGIADANERLVRLLAGQPGREQEANAAAQEMHRVFSASSAGTSSVASARASEPESVTSDSTSRETSSMSGVRVSNCSRITTARSSSTAFSGWNRAPRTCFASFEVFSRASRSWRSTLAAASKSSSPSTAESAL